MKIHLCCTLLAALILVSLLPSSYSEQYSLLVDVSSSKPSYTINEMPVISGTITDSNDNPIQGATVKITTSRGILWSESDELGKFSYQEPKSTTQGFYVVNILVTKNDQKGFATSIYEISGGEVERPQYAQNNSHNLTRNDPLAETLSLQAAKILKQIAEQEQKQKEFLEQKRLFEEKRKLADEALIIDLQRWDNENLRYAPQNAFASFLTHIDESVHAIYWAQFNLTKKISDEAHQAKLKAIENGASREEALKIYQETAAISKEQIIEYNTKIQIDAGVADKDVQKKFNTKGKLPREA
jgi:hypothetical protein